MIPIPYSKEVSGEFSYNFLKPILQTSGIAEKPLFADFREKAYPIPTKVDGLDSSSPQRLAEMHNVELSAKGAKKPF